MEDDSPPQDSLDPAPQTDVPDWIRVTHMRQIATLWPSWEGSFQHSFARRPAAGRRRPRWRGPSASFSRPCRPFDRRGPDLPRERARSVLDLVFTEWARGRNGKPRKRLKGLTPAQAYANSRPTPAETREALEWIQELHRRQERARLTREARSDPVRLQMLDEGLVQLGIPDPARRLAVALAYYSRDAIARGLATFRTELSLGTIPSDADPGRYLGGIIQRLHTRLELDLCSDHLLKQRIRLRDIALDPSRAHRCTTSG